MDSDGSISRDRNWLMPSLAIFSDEWRGLFASWLVRLWLAATVVLTLLSLAGNWAQLRTAPFIASLLFPYLVFPWFLVIMVLGISPVTGARLDALADGILSRPVTRYEYLWASWLARVVVVLAVYAVVSVPAVVVLRLAKRPVAADGVTWYGVIAALTVVGLVLTFLVSIAFLVGTLLRRPMLAAVVLIFVWFPINLVLHTFSLEEFSPISLSQALPTLLRTPLARAGRGNGCRDSGCGRTGRRGSGRSVPQCLVRKCSLVRQAGSRVLRARQLQRFFLDPRDAGLQPANAGSHRSCDAVFLLA